MHELGIVFEVVKRLDSLSSENDILPSDIGMIVLEVGEASTIVPRYLNECWPAAIDNTEFEHVELQVDEIKAKVQCKECGTVYEYLINDSRCPKCYSSSCFMVTGREFNIKEILLYED